MATRKTHSSFRSPRFVALLSVPFAIALPIVIASNRSARVSRKPHGSSTPSMLWRGRKASTNRESEADRMARLFLPEVRNDISPQLRDMVQVRVTPNEVEFGQSIKAPEAMIARGTDSGVILISGISPDTNGEVGTTQRVKIVNKGFQIFDNLTGTSMLSGSDISTIWAGFGGSCETGGAGDAVVLYDRDADRWVISQFASATGGRTATDECFAVSTTSDATGSYYRYAFHLSTNFIDSPHLSVQADGYLMGDSFYNESGSERLGNQFFVFDRRAMLTGAAATFTSPGMDTGVGETYSISAEGVRLASAPGVAPAVSTLTINLTYASDATFTAAGLSATDIVNMKAANTFAASQFTNSFRDPINVNIFVTAVPGTGTLGQSNTSISSQIFTSGIRDPTRADAITPDDATMAGVGGSVPAGLADPIGGTHNWWVTRAQGKALSIAADDLTQDGTYTFGGGFTYTYDPNNRAVAGKFDYIGVSMHEFSEIMGRIYGLGRSLGGNPGYLQMDLFHYTGSNTRSLTNGAGRSFSFNNGTTLLKAFNNASVNGGDAQDWASGTNDSFNAFSSSGVKNDLTAVDLQVMDVIGYNSTAGITVGQGAPNPQLFIDAFNRSGFSQFVNLPPINTVHRWDCSTCDPNNPSWGRGLIQDFNGTTSGVHDALMVGDTNTSFVAQIYGGMWDKFIQLGDLNYNSSNTRMLGYPIADRNCSDYNAQCFTDAQLVSPFGTSYHYQRFQGGALVLHKSGARVNQTFEVHGAIRARWQVLGGPSSGSYGLPITDEYAFQSKRRSDFEGGSICYNPATGQTEDGCTTVSAPSNNNFANAQIINGTLGTVTGTNVGATKESSEPNHAGNTGGASVWYRWQAPATGNATFATTGSNFDTLLAAYTGSSVSNLTLVSSNDDFNGSLQSAITFNAQSGIVYYLAVDGFGGATGSIVLGWSQAGPNYVGYIDGANCTSIRGWAADKNRLNTSIYVNIYADNLLVQTVLANGLRTDVGTFLGDNGLHGFSIPTPNNLKNNGSHLITATFETTVTALFSTRTLNCVTANYIGYIDAANCTSIRGWAADKNRLNTSIYVNIYADNQLIQTVLANGLRTDVGTFLGDNGLHGFSIPPPNNLKNNGSHLITATFESSAVPLFSNKTLNCVTP